MIEGPFSLNTLDLLGQQRLSDLTRRLLSVLLAPKWFQTESVLGQARLYFGDFQPATNGDSDPALTDELTVTDERLRDYICYVLLDFVAVDPELDQVPLAAAFLLADRLALGDRLAQIAIKELQIPKKDITKLCRDAAELVDRTNRQQQ